MFERFFQHVHLDEASVARMIVHIMGLSGKPWHLALDRTNWKFGRCHINILMLGVVHEKVCIPLFWVPLDKAGNSNTRERTDLMVRLRYTGSAVLILMPLAATISISPVLNCIMAIFIGGVAFDGFRPRYYVPSRMRLWRFLSRVA